MNSHPNKASDKMVTIIGLVSALSIFGDAMLYVVLPVYWKEVGLTGLWQVGVLLSINRFVRLPLNPLLGWLYNKISVRTGLLAAVVLGAISTVGYGLWKGFVVWIILRCMWGMAWSMMRLGAYLAVIQSTRGSNGGRLMGTYNGLWKFGSLVGVLFGGVLTPILGIHAVAVTFGLLALIGVPLILFYFKADKSGESADYATFSKLTGTTWTQPAMKVIACGLVVSLLMAVFGSTLTLVIDSHYSQSVMLFGFLLTSTAAGGILQAIRSAWEPFLARWVGHKSDGAKGRIPLLLLSLTAAAIGYALIPWPIPIYGWIVIVLLVMAASTSISTLMDAMAADAARASSPIAVMTAYSVSTDLGAALGPILIYLFIGAQYGITAIYLLGAALFVLCGLWYWKESRQRINPAVDHSGQKASVNEV